MTERQLLDAGRGGDERAYGQLVERYQGELHAHCYRMLGSLHDADDALQEALLRAWRGLGKFEGRSSVKSWLYTITTNVCLKLLERRPRLVLPIDYEDASEPRRGLADPVVDAPWLEPYPDDGIDGTEPGARYERRESIELAFVAALQHLPARQRAVLILRDVLGFTGGEVADQLETTTASVHSALQRAHKAVDERLPERSQQATLRDLSDERLRELVDRYVDAWERNDVDAVVALLAEDAVMSMPPIPTWYAGRDAVADFLARTPLGGELDWQPQVIHANGQLAQAFYARDEDAGVARAHALNLLALDGEKITAITGFLTPELFRRFGLPDEVPLR